MRKAIIGILSLFLCLPFFTLSNVSKALAASESDFTWTDNGDGTATITDYIGTSTDVVIPSNLGGLTVVRIGQFAFKTVYGPGVQKLTSVNLPEGITDIEEGAFEGNAFSSITIPQSVVTIGKNAFKDNPISTVLLPQNVTNIGDYAFFGTYLTRIVIENPTVTIGVYAFPSSAVQTVIIVGYDPSTAKEFATANGNTFENIEGDKSNENDLNFGLKGGELTLSIPTIKSFGTIGLQSQPKTFKTDFNALFNVKDLRGTQEGWRLDVSATPFKVVEPEGGFAEGTTAHTLPVGSLSLVPLQNIERVGTGTGNLPISSLTGNTIIDDGVVTVATAVQGAGMGEFNLTFPTNALSLTVDATTAKVDTINYSRDFTPYETTLTWNLVSAP